MVQKIRPKVTLAPAQTTRDRRFIELSPAQLQQVAYRMHLSLAAAFDHVELSNRTRADGSPPPRAAERRASLARKRIPSRPAVA